MSMAELGEKLDIHCGGIDHINVHHTNEIAQSEAATGKKFFNYWIHGEFLNIAGGKKMAKSDENFLTLENAFLKRDIDPLVYRFACLQTHYRKPMEYDEESILNTREGFRHLVSQVVNIDGTKGKIDQKYKDKFIEAINDDLNMPQSLAVVQNLLKSKLKNEEKIATVLDFDRVLGLRLEDMVEQAKGIALPEDIKIMIVHRNKARQDKNWAESDRIRDEIEKRGYAVEDGKGGIKVYKK